MDTVVEELRERLRRQAFLFDDPRTYIAGVEDALAEVDELIRELESRAVDTQPRSADVLRPA